jgi:hypothetical protein
LASEVIELEVHQGGGAGQRVQQVQGFCAGHVALRLVAARLASVQLMYGNQINQSSLFCTAWHAVDLDQFAKYGF